jgi:hypothetical protein
LLSAKAAVPSAPASLLKLLSNMALKETLPAYCPHNYSLLQRLLLGKTCLEGCSGVEKIEVLECVDHTSFGLGSEKVDSRLICGALPLVAQLGEGEILPLEGQYSAPVLILEDSLINPRQVDYLIYD